MGDYAIQSHESKPHNVRPRRLQTPSDSLFWRGRPRQRKFSLLSHDLYVALLNFCSLRLEVALLCASDSLPRGCVAGHHATFTLRRFLTPAFPQYRRAVALRLRCESQGHFKISQILLNYSELPLCASVCQQSCQEVCQNPAGRPANTSAPIVAGRASNCTRSVLRA